MQSDSPKAKLPLIGIDTDTNEVVIFASVAAVHREIEVYDVDEWELYDADGQVIDISPVEDNRKFLGMLISPPTKIRLQPSERKEPERLRDHMRRYFTASGKPDPGSEASLRDMALEIQQLENQK